MNAVAACPECRSQLLLPGDTDLSSVGSCPSCNATFDLRSLVAQPVFDMIVLPAPAPAAVPFSSRETLSDDDEYRAVGSTITTPDDEDDFLGGSESKTSPLENVAPPEDGGADLGSHNLKSAMEERLTIAEDPTENLEPAENHDAILQMNDEPHVLTEDPTERSDVELSPKDAYRPLDEQHRSPADSKLLSEFDQFDPPAEPPRLSDFDSPKETIDSEEPVEFESELADEQPALDDAEESIEVATQQELEHSGIRPSLVVPPGNLAKRRSPASLRTLVGVLGGGLGGLAVGGLVLYWLLGSRAALLLPDWANRSGSSPAVAGGRADDFSDPSSTDATPTGEIAASYQAEQMEPDEKTGTQPPRPFAEQDALPIPHVRGSPSYAFDDLRNTLEAARRAERVLVEADFSSRSGQLAKGNSYAKFCDLAEVITFFANDSTDEGATVAKLDARDIFRRAVTQPAVRSQVAQLADQWMRWSERPHDGLFLVGVLGQGRRRGAVNEYELETGVGQPLTFVTREPLDPVIFRTGNVLAVAGSLVQNPTDAIYGYLGDSLVTVWAGVVKRVARSAAETDSGDL